MFYTEVRGHTSPSALSQFVSNRNEFEARYFAGEKTFVNKAMMNGTQVHKDIELGMKEVQLRYEHIEEKVTVAIKAGRLKLDLLFIPDSYEEQKNKVVFVDYKTGSEWTQKRAKDDFKQAVCAFGLWKKYGKEVVGAIEHIADDGSTKVYKVKYTEERMKEVEKDVARIVKEINKAYEEYQERTDVFIDEGDLQRYAELKLEKKKIDDELAGLSDRIAGTMEAGGLNKTKTPVGTFFFTERKVYEFPPEIMKLDKELKEKKSDFQKKTKPKKITRTLSYRA